MPYRTIADGGTYWKFYGSSSKLFLVQEVQGKIELMYSNYGITDNSTNYTVFKDKNNNNKVYAAIKSNQIGAYSQVTNTINAFEQVVFELTNAYRAANGKSTLTWQSGLAKASQLHAEDMAINNYLNHIGLNGSTFESRAKNQGVTASAECITSSYANPFYAFDSWVSEPTDNTNLLRSYGGAVGVGWAYNGAGSYKWLGVIMFR